MKIYQFITTFFRFLITYLDVVQFHPATVRSCQRRSERNVFSELAPLSTVWFCALNLKRQKKMYQISMSAESNLHKEAETQQLFVYPVR